MSNRYPNRPYQDQSGQNWVIPSGTKIDVEDGGLIDLNSLNQLQVDGAAVPASLDDLTKLAGVNATADELNTLDGVSQFLDSAALNLLLGTGAINRLVRVRRVTLSANDAAGGMGNFAIGTAGIILAVILNVTTEATGACTVDVGTAANNTTSSDNLIDGADVGAGVAMFNSIDDAGSNGKAMGLVSASDFVTISVASGASAGIAGRAYIAYIEL